MIRTLTRFLAYRAMICLVALIWPAVALAQQVEADLTTRTIAVKADFAGAKVLLFGSVVGGPGDPETPPDIIIVVRGPDEPLSVHRKQRFAGIWVNSGGTTFSAVPGYYAIVTNRPVSDIASSYALQEHRIGFNSVKADLILSAGGFASSGLARDYVDAAVRLLGRKNLYQEHIGGISFVGKHLFRAEFELPANVPLGDFSADVFLFRDGEMVGTYRTPLRIEKSGIERVIYSLAHEQPLIYGILSVLAAIAAGLAASTIFRKK